MSWQAWRLSVLVVVALGLAVSLARAQGTPEPPAGQVPGDQAQVRLTFAPIVADAAPAVVNIFTRRAMTTGGQHPLFNDPLFRRFFDHGMGPPGSLRPDPQNTLGSGVILRAEGVVVTNHHVIDGAEEITVVLSDGREFPADVILRDEGTDLAFLRLGDVADPLPTLDLADSDGVLVGDLVLAIGNPFGVGQTITLGIVSAQARSAGDISDYSFFIQTDAAINPGNSGGALIGVDGRLIGINTAIYSRSGGSMGIGFAIPSNMVSALLAGVDRGTPGLRPWLGAEGQAIDTALADALGLDRPTGVVLTQVTPGGPADQARLQPGDVIVSINGQAITGTESLRYRVVTLALDSIATLQVWRDGEMRTVALTVQPPIEDPPREQTELSGRHPLAGATVVNLSPAIIAETGYAGPAPDGVLVLDLAPGSPAARLRLQPRDVIQAVNGQAIDTVGTLIGAVARPNPMWQIVVRRGERILQTVVSGAF